VILWWRREPRFRKVVRPEEPLREVYCSVTSPEKLLNPDSPCKTTDVKVLRLEGVWFIPDRATKIHWVGEDRFWAEGGGTFLLYPATLRPGACTGEKGDIGYTCEYPDITKYLENEKGWKQLEKGKYFRLRDDVEELGGRIDRFGHPVYIVRNRLGETFRLAGAYARIYHVLRERGGWVEGEELVDKAIDMLLDYGDAVEGFVMRGYEEILVETITLMERIMDRVVDLWGKLASGEVEELPQPGAIPADLEELLARYEELEPIKEILDLNLLAKATKDLYDGNEDGAFWVNTAFMTRLSLGLLVYEALVVEMGVP
jgi:hypothetical protein